MMTGQIRAFRLLSTLKIRHVFIKIVLLFEDWLRGLWEILEEVKTFPHPVLFISPGPEFRE